MGEQGSRGTEEQGSRGAGEQGRGERTFSSYSCSTSAEMIARSFRRASNDCINARICHPTDRNTIREEAREKEKEIARIVIVSYQRETERERERESRGGE